jgi:hypothetical protein
LLDHDRMRLRLTDDDLRELAAEGVLEETTTIGHASLTYALEPGDTQAVTATFIDTRLSVTVPRQQMSRLTSGDQVSIEASQPPLRILIEKDLGRRGCT